MTTTYGGDPSANTKDAIRFILSDTAAPFKWSDEEITYMVSVYETPYAVAAELAFQQAGKYADRRDKTVGPLSIKYGEIGERWYRFANELKSRFSRRGGAKAIMTQVSTGPYIKLGMHDLNYAHNRALELLGEEPLPAEADGNITDTEVIDGGAWL